MEGEEEREGERKGRRKDRTLAVTKYNSYQPVPAGHHSSTQNSRLLNLDDSTGVTLAIF